MGSPSPSRPARRNSPKSARSSRVGRGDRVLPVRNVPSARDIPDKRSERAEGRYDPDVDLGLAESRGVCGECDMRRLDQLAPSAKCQSVDRGDNGLRKGLNASCHLMAGPHEMHDGVCRTRFQVALKTDDIGTGTEGTAGAGKHDDANRRVNLNVVEYPHDRSKQIVAERAQLRWAVQRQDRDAAAVI